MFINNRYKRDADALVKKVSSCYSGDVIVSSPENIDDATLQKIGFFTPIQDAEGIVPSEFGRYTAFNLNGKMIVRKDLEKEKRYVNTFCWSWTLWNGDEQEEYCDIYRDCYPKEFIAPPLEEVTFNPRIKNIFSNKIAITDKDRLLFVVNMFLEIFGSCFVTDNKNDILPIKKVPWIIFPQGTKEITAENLFPNYTKAKKRKKVFIDDRIDLLKKKNPSKILQGVSYFRNYVVFEYEDLNVTILESDSLDNATYVFDKNWQEYSKLTKGEVLSKNLQKLRIIHNKSWFVNAEKLFN